MRTYCYSCSACGAFTTEMKETDKRNDCPRCKCGTMMERDLRMEIGSRRFPEPHEVVSINAGVGVDQVTEGNADLAAHGFRDAHYDKDGNLHCPGGRKQFLKVLAHRGLFSTDEVVSPKSYSGPLRAGKKILR